MRLSNSQLQTVRTRPQSSKLYLSIFQPTSIFKAQVNDSSITKGARVITFDNVSQGSYTAIESGMLMLVGSTPGASDLGKVRARSATSTQVTVGENSNVSWANDVYITVLRFWRLDPVYPRIIQNPANIEDVIFYKDYDISYTNQNSILGTFVNMGCDRAAFRVTGSAVISYSSTGTYNLLGNSLSYHWFFEGGTPSGSTSANPGNVSYLNNGHFVTRLIVSGSNGSSDSGYRCVSIYDKPGEGSSTPVLSWEITSLNGSRDEGGYRASFKIHENISVEENAVIVIFSDDWYGGVNQSFGGNHPNAEKIFFVGRILEDSISYDYQKSQVEFTAGSLTEVMKDSLGFSVSVESKASPSKWYELYDMDCRRAIYHYLKWHTTALSIADFQFVGTDQLIQFFDADRTSMFDAVDNFIRNTLIGQVVSDRQGKVWMEVEAKAYPNPTGSFTSVMEITKRDWKDEPSIEERLSDDSSYLELGGVAYSGVSTGTFSALIASAPGNTPSFRGRIDTRQGLALASQSQLNTMIGNVWANDNSKFPRISMDMAGSYKNLDIAPQETTQMSILSSDTVRGVAVDGLYIPYGFDWRYDPKGELLIPSISFVNLVNGRIGDSVEVPISPADAGINTGFSVPGLQIPPLPILTIPPSLGQIIETIINSLGGGGVHPYGSVGWYDNTFFQQISGVSVGGTSRSAGAGSITVSVGEDGWYLINANVGQTATSVTGEINGLLAAGIQGGKTVNAYMQSGFDTVSAIGRMGGSVSIIVHATVGMVLFASWSTGVLGGSATFANPNTFSLEIHQVSKP